MHLADALARVGFNNVFKGNPKTIKYPQMSSDPSWTDINGTAWVYAKEDFFYLDPEDSNKNWAEFTVRSTIKGYAYNTSGFGPKVGRHLIPAHLLHHRSCPHHLQWSFG